MPTSVIGPRSLFGRRGRVRRGFRRLADLVGSVTFTGTICGDQMSSTHDAGACPPPNRGTWQGRPLGVAPHPKRP